MRAVVLWVTNPTTSTVLITEVVRIGRSRLAAPLSDDFAMWVRPKLGRLIAASASQAHAADSVAAATTAN